MSTSRRDFIKGLGAGAIVLYAGDLIGDLLAQTPPGNPMQSKFKGLADIVLGDAKLAGCSYADVRFTRTINIPGANATYTAAGGRGGGAGAGAGAGGEVPPDPAAFGGGGGRGGGGFGRGGGGGRGGGRGGRGGGNEADGTPIAAGFGVRVIHGGVWGFASSPIVTEDEIRRITRVAIEVAKASAIAKKSDVVLAPVQPYQVYWATPVAKDPRQVSQTDRQAFVQAIVDAAAKNKDVVTATASVNTVSEWKYFASSEGSYIEQEIMTTTPSYNVSARKNDVTRSRAHQGPPGTGGWEIAVNSPLQADAERFADEAAEFCTATPISPGLKDLVLTPAHAMLTIHEVVAHATEIDRIMGYEANYAGTSFVKISDIGKLKYGSKLFNVTADKTRLNGMATIGYDDDGVKTTEFPIVREGILVGLSTNRETARYMPGDKVSRGCTQAGNWSQYPFLRMPNVHVEPGPAGSPTPEQIIADTKDGVMIDGRGSYSIDQQRYNGQFGGNAFWEIKNGKKTRMVTNVTYNAITTDFWGNLDAISGKESWQMYGTGGDAKGQPTQTQNISHGSPWLRIKKIMVGGAFA
jgi:TldD protein